MFSIKLFSLRLAAFVVGFSNNTKARVAKQILTDAGKGFNVSVINFSKMGVSAVEALFITEKLQKQFDVNANLRFGYVTVFLK